MPNQTLDELLDSYGFDTWKTITYQIVLPILNLIGLIFCLLSLVLFNRKKVFKDPVFVYYRLLCLVYCIFCMHNIPMGLVFSPRYYPRMNTYASTIYQIYYAFIGNLMFHYQELLQIAILLTRMTIFDKFLERHFKPYSPMLVSFLLFVVSFLVNLSAAFSSKIIVLGEYFYFDASMGVDEVGYLYDFTNSNFVISKLGSLVLGVTYFILNLICTLIVGITLNIVSFVQFKLYLIKRNQEELRLNNNRPMSTSSTGMQRDINERRAEKNMLYMIISLVFLSIFSRVIFSLGSIYFLYFSNTYANGLIIRFACYFVYSIVPTMSFFIFYSFNRIFRDESRRLIWSRLTC